MTTFYGEDLSYIHDVGHSTHASRLGESILEPLATSVPRGGLVVDLGCGSGVWLRRLVDSGYAAVGIDASAEMIQMASKRAPEARLVAGSIYDVELPQCQAVTALGEVLNYVPDPMYQPPLTALFHRIACALPNGGVFAFDVVEDAPAQPEESQASGPDWKVLVRKRLLGNLLQRNIVSYREVDGNWRSSEETHYQRLLTGDDLLPMIAEAGFESNHDTSLGSYALLPGRRVYLCKRQG